MRSTPLSRLLVLAALMCAFALCDCIDEVQVMETSLDAIAKSCNAELIAEVDQNGDPQHGTPYEEDGMNCQDFKTPDDQLISGTGITTHCCAKSVGVPFNLGRIVSNSANHASISRLLLLLVLLCALAPEV